MLNRRERSESCLPKNKWLSFSREFEPKPRAPASSSRRLELKSAQTAPDSRLSLVFLRVYEAISSDRSLKLRRENGLFLNFFGFYKKKETPQKIKLLLGVETVCPLSKWHKGTRGEESTPAKNCTKTHRNCLGLKVN